MAGGFTLTGAVNLQINNVAQLKRQIKSQFAGTNIQVSVTPTGITKSSAELRKLEREAKLAARQIKTAEDRMASFGQQTGLAAKRFTAFVTGTVILRKLSEAIGQAFTQAIEFEKELVKISQSVGTSLSSLGKLTREVNTLATTFGVSSKALLESSRILVQTGLSARDTTTVLKALAKTELSPSFDNMIDTGEGVIAMMRQFGVAAEDVEAKLGAINAVSKAFAVESQDIVTAIRRTGGAFETAGGSLEELISLFTSVRATTRESAESIATGFRTIFTRIQRTRTLNFLDTLGIKLRDASGQFIGPFESIRKLSEALNSLPSTDPRFSQIIEELGGFRQVSKVIPLIKEFGTAQQALNVAQRGANSLNEDAIKSQEALGRSFTKTREEFEQLIRSFTNDTGVRLLIASMFKLAQSLIGVADAIRPLVPLLGVLFAAKGARLAGSFVRGSLGGKQAGVLGGLGFASGGKVPGSGNGDTVPAMLTPGEFVLTKDAVKNIGVENLKKMNNVQKFAKGGLVDVSSTNSAGQIYALKQTKENKNTGEILEKTPKLNNNLVGDKNATFISYITSKLPEEKKQYGKLLAGKFNLNIPMQSLQISDNAKKIASFYDAQTVQFIDDASSAIVNKLGTNNKDIVDKTLKGDKNFKDTAGGFILEGIISAISGKASEGGTSPIDFIFGSKERKKLQPYIKENIVATGIDGKRTAKSGNDIINKAIRNAFDDKVPSKGRFDGGSFRKRPVFHQKNLLKLLEEIPSSTIAAYDKLNNKKESLVAAQKKFENPKKKNLGGIIPGSGNTDSVPSLLTPGEFVINKKSAKKIGFENLKNLNKMARGGMVHRYASGGLVGSGANAAIVGALLSGSIAQLATTFEGLGGEIKAITGLFSSFAAQFVLLNTSFRAFGASAKQAEVVNKNSENLKLAESNLKELFKGADELLAGKVRLDATIAQNTAIAKAAPSKVAQATVNSATAKTNQEAAQAAFLANPTASNKTALNNAMLNLTKAELVLQQYTTELNTSTEQLRNDTRNRKVLFQGLKENNDQIIAVSDEYTKLETELKKSQKSLNRMNAAIGIGSFAVSALSAGGQFLSDRASKKIEQGDASGRKEAGFGSGLSSAAGVGSLGIGLALVSGPFAPVVLALTGIASLAAGIVSYNSAIKEAERKLRQIQFEKSVEDVGKTLEKINNGTLSSNAGSARIKNFAVLSQEAINNSTNTEELNNQRARIETQLPALQGFFSKVASTSDTLENFKRVVGDDTLSLFARMSGTFLPDLIDQYDKQIKSQNAARIEAINFSNALSEFNRNTTFLVDLASALSVVTTKVRDFDSTIGALSGNFDLGLRDNSAIFSNIGKFGNNRLFNEATNTVSGILGPNGNNAIDQAKLANKTGIALPGLLTNIAASSPLDAEGTFEASLNTALQRLLGGGVNADVIRNTVLNSVSQIIGAEGKDATILEEIRRNLPEITEKITGSFKIFGDALANAAKSLNEIENQFAQGLAKVSELNAKVVEGRLTLVDKQQQAFDILQGFERGPRQFGNFEGRRRNIVEGTTGTSDPATLLSNIIAARGREIGIQQQLNSGVGNRQDLLIARQREIDVVNNSVKALEFFADITSRTKDSLEELGGLDAAQKRKSDFATSFVFGSGQERNQIGDSITNLARVLASGDNINAISADARGGVLDLLKRFGSDRLDTFGRGSDGKIRTGEQVASDIVFKQLLKDSPGADPKFLAELAGKIVTDKQAALQQKISDDIALGLSAQQALVTNTAAQAAATDAILKTGFNAMVSEVQRVVVTLNNQRTQQQKDQLQAELNKNLATKRLLPGLTNVGLNGENNPALRNELQIVRGSLLEREKLTKGQSRFETAIADATKVGGIHAVKIARRISNDTGISEKKIFDALGLQAGVDQTNELVKFFKTGAGKTALEEKLGVEGGTVREIFTEQGAKLQVSGRSQASGQQVTRTLTDEQTARVQQAFIENRLQGLIENEFITPISKLNQTLLDVGGKKLLQTASNDLAGLLDTINRGLIATENIDTSQIDANIARLREAINVLAFTPAPAAPARFASGGVVPGVGSGDRVPALLTPGEFVINKQAAKAIGMSNLMKMNAQKFAEGGPVNGYQSQYQAMTPAQNNKTPTYAQASESKLEACFRQFSGSVDKLSSALGVFPSEVTHKISGQMEVIINGASVFAEIIPNLRNMIVAEVSNQLNKTLKTKFPEL